MLEVLIHIFSNSCGCYVLAVVTCELEYHQVK